MIGLYAADGKTRLAVTYNGLTLNSPTDDLDNTFEVNAVLPHTQYVAISDERPTGDGLEIYEARKISKAYRLIGRVLAPSKAALYDKVELLAKTFDPALISINNPPPGDFLALDFSTPTADTTNFATGLIPSRYYARPLTSVDRALGKLGGLVVPFTLDLLMKDPRRYLQTTSSRTGAGTVSHVGDYPAPATITITASGAGSATYAVKNTSTNQSSVGLVLNLSGLVNADVVTIDCNSRTILKNGVYAGSLFVSGDYFVAEPGTNTIALTNTTNTTTVVSFRAAWSL